MRTNSRERLDVSRGRLGNNDRWISDNDSAADRDIG
jgi:hypothetical protein